MNLHSQNFAQTFSVKVQSITCIRVGGMVYIGTCSRSYSSPSTSQPVIIICISIHPTTAVHFKVTVARVWTVARQQSYIINGNVSLVTSTCDGFKVKLKRNFNIKFIKLSTTNLPDAHRERITY